MTRDELRGDSIFLIRQFLTSDECREYIAASERGDYQDAPITTGRGQVMAKEIRDNARLMVDDPDLADRLWHRAAPFLQDVRTKDWVPVGFNERFRYYRYDVGQRFRPHYDGYFERADGDRSRYTFLIYLNDDFAGGETCFFPSGGELAVRPEAGAALVFYHHQLHEGAPVTAGRKYVLRTDVMFRRVTAPAG